MAWLLPTLLTLAGLCRALHDAQTFSPGCLSRLGPFWDNRESWRNKYKGRDPLRGPKFWLAETWLVGLTDAWHFTNLLAWGCADAAVLLAAWGTSWWWWWAVGGVLARRVVFEPVFNRLRRVAPTQ